MPGSSDRTGRSGGKWIITRRNGRSGGWRASGGRSDELRRLPSSEMSRAVSESPTLCPGDSHAQPEDLDLYRFDDLLSDEERSLRDRVRDFVQRPVPAGGQRVLGPGRFSHRSHSGDGGDRLLRRDPRRVGLSRALVPGQRHDHARARTGRQWSADHGERAEFAGDERDPLLRFRRPARPLASPDADGIRHSVASDSPSPASVRIPVAW